MKKYEEEISIAVAKYLRENQFKEFAATEAGHTKEIIDFHISKAFKAGCTTGPDSQIIDGIEDRKVFKYSEWRFRCNLSYGIQISEFIPRIFKEPLSFRDSILKFFGQKKKIAAPKYSTGDMRARSERESLRGHDSSDTKLLDGIQALTDTRNRWHINDSGPHGISIQEVPGTGEGRSFRDTLRKYIIEVNKNVEIK